MLTRFPELPEALTPDIRGGQVIEPSEVASHTALRRSM